MSDWWLCPSGDASPVSLGDYLWRCPVCGWVYDSFMDEPLLPPHWINTRNPDVHLVGWAFGITSPQQGATHDHHD